MSTGTTTTSCCSATRCTPAHFSIGSGTKLALEDAIALAQAFAERPAVADALPHFQQMRKPIVDALQAAAVESLNWFEHWSNDEDLEPVVFAYRLMTRSGRIDKEKLRGGGTRSSSRPTSAPPACPPPSPGQVGSLATMPPPTPPRAIRHLRWYMAGIFFLATVISYVDRQALSVNAPFIRDDLGLSNIQYSHLVTAFLIAYTIGQSLTGRLVDAFGTRTSFSISIVWWSIAGMLHAAARGFADLALYRFLLGVGEAGSWPASMRGVSEWFPLRERSLAVGIFGGGTAIGAVVAAPLVAGLTLAFGWRACFLVTGTLGFLWLAVWLWLYHPPEQHPRLDPAEREMILSQRVLGERGDIGMLDLLRDRKPWGVMLGRSLVDPAWWFYVFWLPNYLKNERGFGLEAIGLFAWIPFLAADIGNVTGGWLSGQLLRRGFSLTVARKSVLLLGALGTLFGVPAVGVVDAWLCLLLISAATFSFGLWTTTAMTLNADVVPHEGVGRMTGLSGTASGLGGILFTLLTGWLVDRFSYAPVFWLAGLLPLLGFVLLATLTGEIRAIDLGERLSARRTAVHARR